VDKFEELELRLQKVELYLQELRVDRATESVHYDHIKGELTDIKDILKGYNIIIRNLIVGAGGIIGASILAWILAGGLTK